jgi:hypothetical protein
VRTVASVVRDCGAPRCQARIAFADLGENDSLFRAGAAMTYEEYLDEVTTLITERYDVSDEDAIKHVMRAQAADFFSLHDDLPEMRTHERAEQDAKTVFEQRNKSRPHSPKHRGPTK